MSVFDRKPIASMSVTATYDSDIVVVTGGHNCGFVAVGTIVAIGAYPLYDAISGTAADPSGTSTIKLARKWMEPTVTDKMLVFMSYEGLSSAVYDLNVLLNKLSAERNLTLVYKGSYDLAGNQVLPTPSQEIMEMWRIQSEYIVDGIKYSVGDLIYFDKFASKWRTMWEAVGSAAKENVQETEYALTGKDVLRRSDFGIGSTFTAANPEITANSTPAQILSLTGDQVHYVTKTLVINSENPEPKGTIKGYVTNNPIESSWQEFIGVSGRTYRRVATSADAWSVFTKVMLHGDVDTDTVFNVMSDEVTFNSTPTEVLNYSGEGAFYFMQTSSASGMPESKGSVRGYINSTDNYTNSWQEYIGISGAIYRRTAKNATEWNTYVKQLDSNELANINEKIDGIQNQVNQNKEDVIDYVGDYDLSAVGALPPIPTVGSEIRRISTPATIDGRTFVAGEMVISKKGMTGWNSFHGGLGSAARLNAGTSSGNVQLVGAFNGPTGEQSYYHSGNTLNIGSTAVSARAALELGNAARRNAMETLTDTETSNALMLRGAFGLGSTYAQSLPYVANINQTDSFNASGLFRYNDTTVGVPSAAQFKFGAVLNAPTIRVNNLNYGWQLLGEYASNQLFFRNIAESNPAPWKEVLFKGDFGIGGISPSGASLEDVLVSGIYREEQPSSGFAYTSTLNMSSGDGRQQLTISRGGDHIKFRGRVVPNSVSADPAHSWSPWKTLYHDRNILGTVSQSSGVPTGAIIQRGTNAVGHFTMFADGTVEYWGRVNLSGLSINPARNGNGNTVVQASAQAVIVASHTVQTICDAEFYDANGTYVYVIEARGSGGQLFMNLGTRPAAVWPQLDVIGSSVITSGFYTFRVVGRWF